MKELKLVLESAWDDGFFYDYRYGDLNRAKYDILIDSLRSFPKIENSTINSDLVRYLWFIPTFLQDNKAHLIERGYSEIELKVICEELFNECVRILGLP
ncbi:MAG: hypothetical protein HWE07_00780 [Cytophagia bacterium]|nr:hypothetical protein [Cytophagia bacterium]